MMPLRAIAGAFPWKGMDGMDDAKVYDVAVIGAGPAGMTSALYACRAGYSCVMIEAISYGGQLAQTEHLENYPGFNSSTSGFELSEIMYAQATAFGAETIYDEVVRIEPIGAVKTVVCAYTQVKARAIIIATGARPAKLGLPNEDALKGQGVSYCATCDGSFFKGKDVIVVGGGDTAAADAIYLSRICNRVIMVVRRDALRATAVYHHRLEQLGNVEILWNSNLLALEESDGAVSGAVIRNNLTQVDTHLTISAAFIAIGTVPNVEFLNSVLELAPTGHIDAGADCRTSIEGVFAAGDVRTKPLRQVTTAVGDGANAVESCAEYLSTMR